MLIGRENEIKILNDALNSDESHFIAVYGRRRVGKTYLIKETFGGRFTFKHTGIYNGKLQTQLLAFKSSLSEYGLQMEKSPHCYMEAFDALKNLICNSTESKKIIFIDELSWMDTPKSDFMQALEHFWNGWASYRNDIVLIVCASATSWMLSKVVHSKGGLYNRLTRQIHLQPFSLAECEALLYANNLTLTKTQILQSYMIFGGIPYYWNLLERGQSLAQNIDRLFFSKDAVLRNEYKYLYSSIFKNPSGHIKIVETLGLKKSGMTRDEIINISGLSNSGDLSLKLEELESCGFIRKYSSLGKKKKNTVYQLIDFFTLFYFDFLSDISTDEHYWSEIINTPKYNTWMGLAFERVCLLHTLQIKKKLGIQGVLSEEKSWYAKADPESGIQGSQIDLLIVRRDGVMNLCEIKYSESEFIVNQKTESDIRRKISDLNIATKSKYAVQPVLITPFGIVDNTHSNIIQSVVTSDDLFSI